VITLIEGVEVADVMMKLLLLVSVIAVLVALVIRTR
jgi:hydrogenase maturation factor